MKEILSAKELEIANNIIGKGFIDAAKSLSYFTKCEMQITYTGFIEGKINLLSSLSDKENESYFQLKSVLVGDLQGCCYLWCTESHVAEIMNAFYKGKVMDELMYFNKSNNLMLEIDNIVTAAVTSHFANSFNSKIYAGVPELKRLSKEDIFMEIEKEKIKNKFFLNFDTLFHSDFINVKAEFGWFIDESFIQITRNLVNKE